MLRKKGRAMRDALIIAGVIIGGVVFSFIVGAATGCFLLMLDSER